MNNRNVKHPPLASINVVPYIDVMLVLLIIFMVTAPLLTEGVKVNLPAASSSALSQTGEPVVISIKKNRLIYLNINDRPKFALNQEKLITKIKDYRKLKPEAKIFIRADRDVDYGTVLMLLSDLRQADIKTVGLVTGAAHNKNHRGQ